MKNLFYLLTILLLVFSSCSGKKYGHYSYTKKQKAISAKINKHRQQKNHSQQSLPQINSSLATVAPVWEVNINDSLKGTTPTAATPQQKTVSVPKKPVASKFKRIFNKPSANTAKPTAVDDDIPTEHSLARTSLYLGIAALVLSLLGIALPVLGILGTALGITTFITSIISLKEINRNPGLYSNRGMAIAGLVIGILYLLAILLALLYIAFVVVAILLLA